MKSYKLLRICRALAAILLSGLGLTASAKTVALWPIEWNEGTYCGDFRCRIDPANDFTASSVTADKLSVPGTELPPNPCADVAEEFACNYSSYLAKDDASQKQPHYTSTGAARYVTTTNDFTVEFWFRLDKMPGNGKWFMLAGYNTHNNVNVDSERWFVSLRQNGSGNFYWNLAGHYLTNGSDVNSATLPGDDFIKAYSNSWHHAALAFRHNVGGMSVAKLYVDSEVMVDTTSKSIAPDERRPDGAKPPQVFGVTMRKLPRALSKSTAGFAASGTGATDDFRVSRNDTSFQPVAFPSVVATRVCQAAVFQSGGTVGSLPSSG